jgi:hypothetical protein
MKWLINLFGNKRKVYEQRYIVKNPILSVMGIYSKSDMPLAFKFIEMDKFDVAIHNEVPRTCCYTLGLNTIYFFSDFNITKVIVNEVSEEQMKVEIEHYEKSHLLYLKQKYPNI